MGMKKFLNRLGLTFSAFIMSPMLADDPKSTPQSRSKMFWEGLRAIWSGKLDDKEEK